MRLWPPVDNKYWFLYYILSFSISIFHLYSMNLDAYYWSNFKDLFINYWCCDCVRCLWLTKRNYLSSCDIISESVWQHVVWSEMIPATLGRRLFQLPRCEVAVNGVSSGGRRRRQHLLTESGGGWIPRLCGGSHALGKWEARPRPTHTQLPADHPFNNL